MKPQLQPCPVLSATLNRVSLSPEVSFKPSKQTHGDPRYPHSDQAVMGQAALSPSFRKAPRCLCITRCQPMALLHSLWPTAWKLPPECGSGESPVPDPEDCGVQSVDENKQGPRLRTGSHQVSGEQLPRARA